MSLAPKIDGLQASLSSCFGNTDIICITETWLSDRISDSAVNLPGFSITRRDRSESGHGGVCAYIKEEVEFSRLTELESVDYEILWVEMKPKRLPRKIKKLIFGVLYRPPSANDESIKEYLFGNLQKIESNHSNCGIILTGDFNHLNITNICRHFGFKQVVKFPTRGDVTLDLILTNISEFYSEPKCYPPLGLSDHCTIHIASKQRRYQR